MSYCLTSPHTTNVLQVFQDLHFTLMEMNPFTLDKDGEPFPLDMRGELDDTAAFKSGKKWGDVEFPLPFGRTMSAAEEYVHELDSNTGKASACKQQQATKFDACAALCRVCLEYR